MLGHPHMKSRITLPKEIRDRPRPANETRLHDDRA